MTLPKIVVQYEPADQPLLNRAPVRDELGRALSDLMMLYPKLRDQPRLHIARVVRQTQAALEKFPDDVLFAEFNVSRNLLWVSVRPISGIRAAIANAIRERVPEAKLVSHG